MSLVALKVCDDSSCFQTGVEDCKRDSQVVDSLTICCELQSSVLLAAMASKHNDYSDRSAAWLLGSITGTRKCVRVGPA